MMMPYNHKIYPSLAMDEVVGAFAEQANHTLEPIHFAFGQSSFNPFEFVHLQLSHTMLGDARGYGQMKGLLSLREAICSYYQEIKKHLIMSCHRNVSLLPMGHLVAWSWRWHFCFQQVESLFWLSLVSPRIVPLRRCLMRNANLLP